MFFGGGVFAMHIFRPHDLRKDIWVVTSIKEKVKGSLICFFYFLKISSSLIESTWFTAKLDGCNHVTF